MTTETPFQEQLFSCIKKQQERNESLRYEKHFSNRGSHVGSCEGQEFITPDQFIQVLKEHFIQNPEADLYMLFDKKFDRDEFIAHPEAYRLMSLEFIVDENYRVVISDEKDIFEFFYWDDNSNK